MSVDFYYLNEVHGLQKGWCKKEFAKTSLQCYSFIYSILNLSLICAYENHCKTKPSAVNSSLEFTLNFPLSSTNNFCLV